MLCLLNEEFLMRKNNLQREKLKLEVEKLFFLLQVHFPPLEYAKFTARKTRHEVDKSFSHMAPVCPVYIDVIRIISFLYWDTF